MIENSSSLSKKPSFAQKSKDHLSINMKRRPRGNSINIESKLSFNTLYKTANDNSTGENKDFNDSLNDRITKNSFYNFHGNNKMSKKGTTLENREEAESKVKDINETIQIGGLDETKVSK